MWNEGSDDGIFAMMAMFGGIGGTAITAAMAFTGLRHGALTACAAYALGPAGFASLAYAPRLLAFAPCGLGLAVTGASLVGPQRVHSPIKAWFWCSYAAGAFAGGKLVSRPRILVPVGVCMALWECL